MIHAEERVVELVTSVERKGGLAKKNPLHDFAKNMQISGLSDVHASHLGWLQLYFLDCLLSNPLSLLGKEGISPHPHLC